MYNSLFIGIDPAPAASGLSIYIPEKSLIETYSLTTEKSSKSSDFISWYVRATAISNLVESIIYSSEYQCQTRLIVMETPPPIGSFSAGLFGMDSILLSKLHDCGVVLTHCKKIYSLIGFNGTKKDVEKVVIETCKLNNIIYPKFESDHESDASIYALWGYNMGHNNLLLPRGDKKLLSTQWQAKISQVYSDAYKNITVYK